MSHHSPANRVRRSSTRYRPYFLIPLTAMIILAIIAAFLSSRAAATESPRAAASATPQDAVATPQVTNDTGSTIAPEITSTGIASQAVAAAEQTSDYLGVAILDRATNELSVGKSGNSPFYSASIVKLIVAVDILERRDAGETQLSENDLDLINRALGPSDDNAMNELWDTYDGPTAVTNVVQELKLTTTEAPEDTSQWGSTVISAADIAKVYEYIDDMPAASRDILISAMAAAPDQGTDGFDQNFGIPATFTDSAAKQGWMCCINDNIDLHSTGAVDNEQYVVVILSSQPSETGWDQARQTLTTAAKSGSEYPGLRGRADRAGPAQQAAPYPCGL